MLPRCQVTGPRSALVPGWPTGTPCSRQRGHEVDPRHLDERAGKPHFQGPGLQRRPAPRARGSSLRQHPATSAAFAAGRITAVCVLGTPPAPSRGCGDRLDHPRERQLPGHSDVAPHRLSGQRRDHGGGKDDPCGRAVLDRTVSAICTCTAFASSNLAATPASRSACERTHVSATSADSLVTAPTVPLTRNNPRPGSTPLRRPPPSGVAARPRTTPGRRSGRGSPRRGTAGPRATRPRSPAPSGDPRPPAAPLCGRLRRCIVGAVLRPVRAHSRRSGGGGPPGRTILHRRTTRSARAVAGSDARPRFAATSRRGIRPAALRTAPATAAEDADRPLDHHSRRSQSGPSPITARVVVPSALVGRDGDRDIGSSA